MSANLVVDTGSVTHIAIGELDRGRITWAGRCHIVDALGLGHDYSALGDDASKVPKAAAGWYSVAHYRGEKRIKSEIAEPLTILSFDADAPGDAAALPALARYRCVVIETSRSAPSGRRHRVHLDLATPVPIELYSAVLLAAARALGFNVEGSGVQQAKDPSRLWYRGVRRVVAVHTGEPFDWRMLPLAPAVRQQRPTTGDGVKVEEGGRNDFLSREAFRLRKNGASIDAIATVLLAMNEVQCDPPLDDAEVRAIAGGKARVARDDTPPNIGFGAVPLLPGATTSAVPPPPSRFTPVEARAFALGPDPRQRVAGLLPESGLAMVYGPSGVGKSFWLADIAMAVTRGVSYGYAQRAVMQGRVVYVVAEGVGGFRSRLRAYWVHHELTDCPGPRIVSAAPNFMLATDTAELIAAIGASDMVVVDTLHATIPGGNENDSKDSGIFLANLRAIQHATGGLVVVIHHSGKNLELGARGSTSIKAAMDAEIEMTRHDDYCVARVTKMRDGPDDAVAFFRLVPVVQPFGDRPTSSAVVEHLPAPEKPVKARKGRASDDQALVVEHVRRLMETYPNGVQRTVLVAAIQSERPDKEREDNLKRSISRAIDNGLLTIESNDYIRLALR